MVKRHVKISSFVRLTPDQADVVAHYLYDQLELEDHIIGNLKEDFQKVTDALFALSNDTDAIVCTALGGDD
tara:strand:- start:8190 stop:8402 length:213 start_codon:yes stop_codon:yes gene_type:complete